jgi:hypothetical protein
MKGRTISNQDVKTTREKFQKLIPKKLRSTQAANSISNKDVKTIKKLFNSEEEVRRFLLDKARKSFVHGELGSPISNKDVKILEEALKRNDGGIARKTRVF